MFKGNNTYHGRVEVRCNNDSSWTMDNATLHNEYECKRELVVIECYYGQSKMHSIDGATNAPN